jgi:hypothetical protein
MLLLPVNVSPYGFELTRAHRKCAVSALPGEAAIPRINRLDPFRGRLLYLLDELGLRKSSWQRCDDMNVIRHTADVHSLSAKLAADRGEISYACASARPNPARVHDPLC